MEIPPLRPPFPGPSPPSCPPGILSSFVTSWCCKLNCSSLLLKFCLSYTMFLSPNWKSWKQGGRGESKKAERGREHEWEYDWLDPLELLNYSFYPVSMKCGPSCTKPLTLNTHTEHTPMKAAMYSYPVIVICLLHDSRLCYNY